MIITDIKPQKRKKDRVNIYVDGRFSFAIDLESLLKHHLKVNQSLTQAEVDQLIKDNEFGKWYNRTLEQLSFRPRSEKEIKDYLHKHEVGETTSEQVINKLQERGLINDQSFAQWFVKQRSDFKPKGKIGLRQELRLKGVSDEVISETLEKDLDTSTEIDQATQVIQKKLTRWQSLPPQEQKLKISQFLARRGFSWSVVEAVLARFNGINAFDAEEEKE